MQNFIHFLTVNSSQLVLLRKTSPFYSEKYMTYTVGKMYSFECRRDRANGLRLHHSCISYMAINVRVVAFDNLTTPFGYFDYTRAG